MPGPEIKASETQEGKNCFLYNHLSPSLSFFSFFFLPAVLRAQTYPPLFFCPFPLAVSPFRIFFFFWLGVIQPLLINNFPLASAAAFVLTGLDWSEVSGLGGPRQVRRLLLQGVNAIFAAQKEA